MQSGDNDEYAKHDLRAQQEMSEWALAMLIVSVAGLAVTAVGLGYVILTFRQNVEATRAATAQAKTAREHLERMETPFLRAVPVQPPESNTGKPYEWLRDTVIRLENCGRSYAIVTNETADTGHFSIVSDRRFDPRRDWGRYVGNALIVPADGFSVPLRAAPPHEIDAAYREAEAQGGALHGIVRYRDALGNRYVMGFAFTYVVHMREYIQLVDPDSNYHYREDEMPYPPAD